MFQRCLIESKKSSGVGNKVYVMSINTLSLENLDPMTIHEYLSLHQLASDDHCTPTPRAKILHTPQGQICLFLNDSCSNPQQIPKASNPRKMLWVIQEKMLVETYEKFSLLKNSGSVGCLQHTWHCATPVPVFIPLDFHSLEKTPSVMLCRAILVPASWLMAALILPLQGFPPLQGFALCFLFCSTEKTGEEDWLCFQLCPVAAFMCFDII